MTLASDAAVSDPLAPWAFAVSLVSLGVAATVAYRTEFRGARVTFRLRNKPASWNARVYQTAAGSPGDLIEIGRTDKCPNAPLIIRVSGDWSASADNPGSQDGLLWGLALAPSRLPDPWTGGGTTDKDAQIAVSKKGSTPIAVRVTLSCEGLDLPTAIQELEKGRGDFTLAATYTAHRGLGGRAAPAKTSLAFSRTPVIAELRRWSQAHT